MSFLRNNNGRIKNIHGLIVDLHFELRVSRRQEAKQARVSKLMRLHLLRSILNSLLIYHLVCLHEADNE